VNITELLHTALEIDPKHVCLNITTTTDLYPLCFIEYEDAEKIAAYITGQDGRERLIIIYKDQIVSFQVVYENDIEITTLTDKGDVMIQ
jgi:hypothetical protein